MNAVLRFCTICIALGLAFAMTGPAQADEPGAGMVTLTPEPPAKPTPGKHLEEPPVYGVYYDRREPSFYTGFAPRSQDPDRVHLQIGRGNQLRITAVLSDEAIAGYARDLLYRYRTYRALIDKKRVVLTQNTSFEDFAETIDEVDLEDLVEEEDDLSAAELRERNLELMEERQIFDHAAAVGEVFQARMQNFADHPLVGNVRGKGLIGAIELVANKETKARFDASAGVGTYCMNQALEHGLIVRALGASVAFCPPLIITEDQVDELFSKFGKALDETLSYVGNL